MPIFKKISSFCHKSPINRVAEILRQLPVTPYATLLRSEHVDIEAKKMQIENVCRQFKFEPGHITKIISTKNFHFFCLNFTP